MNNQCITQTPVGFVHSRAGIIATHAWFETHSTHRESAECCTVYVQVNWSVLLLLLRVYCSSDAGRPTDRLTAGKTATKLGRSDTLFGTADMVALPRGVINCIGSLHRIWSCWKVKDTELFSAQSQTSCIQYQAPTTSSSSDPNQCEWNCAISKMSFNSRSES